jgi:Adenylate and Guanylate cyclase catalytic domain
LKNAATIGTALMVVNSQRALILMVLVVIVLPLLNSINQQNLVAVNFTKLLEASNLEALSGIADCEYMELAIESWLNMAVVPQPPSEIRGIEYTFVLWAQVLPVRCPFQNETGVITSCRGRLSKYREMPVNEATCDIWDTYSPSTSEQATAAYFAEALNLRQGGIVTKIAEPSGESGNIDALDAFTVTVVYNENPTISLANMGLFYLLLATLILGLYFLQALRGDAIRLVLDPLQRMLKIVLRYAENPLSQYVNKKSQQDKTDDDSAIENEGEEIGNFETEQLINAITKIADLLRKCWGVAGAGIISSNLARTKDGKTVVFNPTVPGKRVYALFGFVAINGFSEILRALDRDIMILINDVAQVVHDEVYRWALGEHGQCNKNLGPAFLMVWRIGDFSEVHKKKQVATEKLFRDNAAKHHKRSTLRRRYKGSGRRSRNDAANREIQLESLPGIQAFTDRALLGMLKSFAGIHRDKRLTNWKNDFRLSAGVGAYHADIMYGMDAGWAVEGAVGSEYKIDATYLSPHVNMASRMMSATKQYGVTILLSKAVEKLLSKNCRKKLRHLDTVYVKGSKVKQNIFTYDARFQGVDFFLLERTPEQADLESELYTPNIWDQDQDLRAMRQHVSEAFMETYHLAVKQYLGGNWKDAYDNFQAADSIMIEKVLDDGYLEIDLDEMEDRIFDREDTEEDVVRLRNELGDGACRTLMNFMKRRNLTPPRDWDAVRQLFSK